MPEGTELLRVYAPTGYNGVVPRYDNPPIKVWATRLSGTASATLQDDVAAVISGVTFRVREYGITEITVGWRVVDWHGKEYQVASVVPAEFRKLDITCERVTGRAS